MSYYKIVLVVLFSIFSINIQHAYAQCDQKYNWTTWKSFPGTNATGTINNNGDIVNVTMTANYTFSSTSQIWNYAAFSGFKGGLPNSTTPATTWSIGPQGNTTMCFDKTVKNPVLVLSSIGAPGLPVTLKFSRAYKVVYDGGGNTFVNDSTITGAEGYVVLVFPGDFTCVSIYSTTYEYYTNITWGLNPPLFPISVNGKTTDCEKATLTASGGVSYLWSGGNTPNSATNTFTKSGTYFLTVTDNNGCQVITSQDITIKTKSYKTIDTTVCWGQSVKGHNSSGTYTETLTAANGCDSVITLKLTVRPAIATTIKQTICEGSSYLGYGTTGIYTDKFISVTGCDSTRTLDLTVNKKIFTAVDHTICEGSSYLGYNSTGVYKDVFVSQTGCDSTRTLNLTVTKKINTAVSRTICAGESYLGYNSSGTYKDLFVSQSGCDSTRTLNLVVLAPIATNVSKSVCEGETYSGHSSAGVYTDKFTSINGCDSVRTLTLTVIKKVYTTVDHAICDGETYLGYKVAGSYKDVFASQFGCDSIRTLNLTVNPRPVAVAGTDAAICFGDEVQLSASGGESYLWSPSTYLNNPNISDPLATPEHTITYFVSAKDINGCTSNAEQVTITVIRPQVFAGKDTAVIANQPLQLNAISLENSTFVQYIWSPALGLDDPKSQKPIASVNSNTMYILTAYTANGCKATDTINIQIFKELRINMPNAFTPNGDGKNDIFRPLAVGIKTLNAFRIYSRWGELLFSTSAMGQGWDGTSKGVPQNAGNYIWQISGIDSFGKPFSQNGNVVLIR